MRIIIEDEEAVERVRRRAGDKSATETVARLICEADRGPCKVIRGDGRVCGAPIGLGDAVCLGCITDTAPKGTRCGDESERRFVSGAPKRTRKGAK